MVDVDILKLDDVDEQHLVVQPPPSPILHPKK